MVDRVVTMLPYVSVSYVGMGVSDQLQPCVYTGGWGCGGFTTWAPMPIQNIKIRLEYSPVRAPYKIEMQSCQCVVQNWNTTPSERPTKSDWNTAPSEHPIMYNHGHGCVQKGKMRPCWFPLQNNTNIPILNKIERTYYNYVISKSTQIYNRKHQTRIVGNHFVIYILLNKCHYSFVNRMS